MYANAVLALLLAVPARSAANLKPMQLRSRMSATVFSIENSRSRCRDPSQTSGVLSSTKCRFPAAGSSAVEIDTVASTVSPAESAAGGSRPRGSTRDRQITDHRAIEKPRTLRQRKARTEGATGQTRRTGRWTEEGVDGRVADGRMGGWRWARGRNGGQ